MPGSPNQNSVAEKRKQTLMHMVRSVRSNAKLPQLLLETKFATYTRLGCLSKMRIYNSQERN
ncbi:hypothetical protein CR513_33876, partial [Mucuna pruriens]